MPAELHFDHLTSAEASPLRIPIDHVLHSPAVVVVNRAIGPDVKSDHLPVIVDFVVMEQLP